MKLLVVRHGPAGGRKAWLAAGRDDAARPLTPEGRRKVREAARGLARLVPAPLAMATSPLARARQTADLLAGTFGLEGVEEVPALEPGRHPRELIPWLERRRRRSLVAVVGHEPALGTLAGFLLAGRAEPLLELGKGGACLLDLGPRPRAGHATLLWSLPPAMLRRLARQRGR